MVGNSHGSSSRPPAAVVNSNWAASSATLRVVDRGLGRLPRGLQPHVGLDHARFVAYVHGNRRQEVQLLDVFVERLVARAARSRARQ